MIPALLAAPKTRYVLDCSPTVFATVSLIPKARPSPSPGSAGIVTVAVAPLGVPLGVIASAAWVLLLVPTISQVMLLMPVSDWMANVTTAP
jgi:hypothetical protein